MEKQAIDKPKIYLSNWSSARTPGHHGPGRKLTFMARPRRWEHGEGRVCDLVPNRIFLAVLRRGNMTFNDYRKKYKEMISELELRKNLVPGRLYFVPNNKNITSFEAIERGFIVKDGDTLCCACSRKAASEGNCHRTWAAPYLHKAGWEVILDGEIYEPGGMAEGELK